ncbi:MAG: DUF4019 domain-containing protein [Pyrinomonadaceae bacterium]
MSRRAKCAVLLIVLTLVVSACAVSERRSGLPTAAQNAIDTITDDIAAGRDDKIYQEAADEWRQAATPEQSRASFERVRNTFGKVLNRALVEGREQQASGHTVTASFNTRFERGDAIETFTLVERDGRWLLARYAIHSDVLK